MNWTFLFKINRGCKVAFRGNMRSPSDGASSRFAGLIFCLGLTILAHHVSADPVQIGMHLKGKLASDQSNSPLSIIPGRLAYTFFSKEEGHESGLSIVNNWQGKQSITSFPLVKPSADDFDYLILEGAVFSPGGRYVCVKMGEVNAYPNWSVYIYDSRSGDFCLVKHTSAINYPVITWSPDEKYVSYLLAGDDSGDPYDPLGNYVGSLSLALCDWREGKEKIVAVSNSLRGSFGWCGFHTLVWGALSNENEKKLESLQSSLSRIGEKYKRKSELEAAKGSLHEAICRFQPSVYSYSIDEDETKDIAKDGYRPIVSPNGHSVAYFGSEDAKKPIPLRDGWEDHPNGTALIVRDLEKSDRVILSVFNRYPQIIWEKDNIHLITLEEIDTSRCEIKEWDTRSGQLRNIRELVANDKGGNIGTLAEPQFLPIGIVANGSKLIVRVMERNGSDASGNWKIVNYSFKTYDLKSGAEDVLFTLHDVNSADFVFDETH